MKKKWFKILLVMAGLGIVAAVLVLVFIYNKPHPNYEKKAPDFTLTATELFMAYKNNSEEASQKYNGTMIAVEGELSLVETFDESVKAYFVLGEGLFGDEGVRITMLPSQSELLKEISPGSRLTIKGYATGYNDTDVILEHGSLLNSN